MGLERLNSLYQTVIMDHYQHPRNQHAVLNPTHQMELLNPTCGDSIMIECRVEEDILVEVGYSGIGCAISMASASMMSQALTGLPVSQVLEVIEEFNSLVGGQSPRQMTDEALKAILKEAVLLENIKQFPARYKCAILAWRAVEKGLNGEESGEAI